MTKDGRPSRITDIRHFFGDLHTYLKGHEEAVAFGRRMAWFLNGEGFSLGAYPALYLYFTPSLPPGAAQVTDYGGDWWQRYTHVGVTQSFPATDDADEVVMSVMRRVRANGRNWDEAEPTTSCDYRGAVESQRDAKTPSLRIASMRC